MNGFINFIMGPMVWISFLIFVFGVLYNIIRVIVAAKAKEPFVFEYMQLKYSLRSIGAWLIPFFPKSTRQQPVFYAVSYLFHLALFLAPIFLMSHIMLIEEAFGITWFALNDGVADILTLIVIAALIFFTVRRMIQPEVKFLTSFSDYLLIAVVCLPFITGFLAYHQFFAYRWITIIHVICGELMLILLPFSRLRHMILAPLTRGFMGSEFGGVRHTRDW